MINCHNFSRDISGENFNLLCLELEILGKVYTPPAIPSCFGNHEREATRRVNTYFALGFFIYAFYRRKKLCPSKFLMKICLSH